MNNRKSLRNRNTLRSSSYGDADPLKCNISAPTANDFERFCRTTSSTTTKLQRHQSSFKELELAKSEEEDNEESAYSLLEDEEDEEDDDDELISQSLLSSPLIAAAVAKRENWSNSRNHHKSGENCSFEGRNHQKSGENCSFEGVIKTRNSKEKKNYNLSKLMADQFFHQSTAAATVESSPQKPIKQHLRSRKRRGRPRKRASSSPNSSNSSSSSNSSEDDDDDEACIKRFKIHPLTTTTTIGDGASLECVAGLDSCISKLKEMVTFPLLYPGFYQRIGIAPSRGILFHGPPGTGKTLVARALANFCSKHAAQRISFYLRNGGDCLSKYIGEAERSIRLLFQEARKNQPSIIFFDEIDAIAPARTQKSEQSHISVVATLLAEMDGLSDRGQIVVIGATNRLQSLDPALRRPGRFDREFYFPMPGRQARKGILQAHTKNWGLHEHVIEGMAEITQGYSGSDIKGLCLEAATKAFNRRISSLSHGHHQLADGNDWNLDVSIIDFMQAYREIVPSSVRHSPTGITASKHSKILVDIYLGDLLRAVRECMMKAVRVSFENLEVSVGSLRAFIEGGGIETEQYQCFKPRILVRAKIGMLSDYVVMQSLGLLEDVFVHNLDVLQLYSASSNAAAAYNDAGNVGEGNLIRILNDVRASTPSILFIPQVSQWWDRLSVGMQDIFTRFIASLHPRDPILVLATLEEEEEEKRKVGNFELEFPDFFLPPSITYTMQVPSSAHRRLFFHSVFQRFRFDTGTSFSVLEQEIVEFNRRAEEKLQEAIEFWRLPRQCVQETFHLLERSEFKTCSDMEAFLGLELDKYHHRRAVSSSTPNDHHHLMVEGGFSVEAFKEFMHQQLFQIDASLIMKLEDLKHSKSTVNRTAKRIIFDQHHTAPLSGQIVAGYDQNSCTQPPPPLNSQVLLDDCVVGKLVDFVTQLTDSFTLTELEHARTEIEKYGIHRDNKFLFQEFERYMLRVFPREC